MFGLGNQKVKFQINMHPYISGDLKPVYVFSGCPSARRIYLLDDQFSIFTDR